MLIDPADLPVYRPGAARLREWPRRLSAYLGGCKSRPFVWGEHDCVTFAAGVLQALTGCRPELPQWGSAREALRILRQRGGLACAVRAQLGEPMDPRYLAVGDLAMVATLKREAMAVCNGAVMLAPGPQGLVARPMRLALRGWRV